jgi:very-short-patch-repair endonuclease
VIDPLEVVRGHGGLAATHELYAAGFDRHSLAVAVRRREVIRVRQGWFAAAGLDPGLRAAARVGGRATCRTALRLAGLWCEPDVRVHIVVPSHAVRLRTTRSPLLRRRDVGDPLAVVHWRDAPGESRLILDAADALVDLASCGDVDEIAAATDAILRKDPLARPQIRLAAARLPRSMRDAVLEADGVCESGIETILWRRLRRNRIPARRQVTISRVGRVDFVIGHRLVVEVDGERYHSDPIAFEADRRRDAALSSAGYRVLRFSYQQVRHDMSLVDAAISAAIARGDADE